ncbi:acetyl-CoA carboxylase biotin carboxylase subunit family protein [Vibrio splendidus]
MNKKIAIIGANEFQLDLILKAKSKGYETHVFAWETGDVGEFEADYFYPISITDKEAILEKCRVIGIDGVVSIASDLAIITVNFIANRLNLVGNSPRCSELTTNKYLMRQALFNANLPVPLFQLVSSTEEVDNRKLSIPSIVKPIDRSGSRGITLINSLDELDYAIKKSQECSFVNDILIEEFIDGREFSVESISHSGKHQILQITEKFTTGSPGFIERGHLSPARISVREKSLICKVVTDALNCLEVRHGASHSEIKLDSNDEVKIIEIGGRMGGDFIGSYLVENNTGFDFTNGVVDIAVNTDFHFPEGNDLDNADYCSMVVYYFSSEEFDCLSKIESMKDVKIIKTQKNKNFNGEVTSSAERFGYSFINTPFSELPSILTKLGI